MIDFFFVSVFSVIADVYYAHLKKKIDNAVNYGGREITYGLEGERQRETMKGFGLQAATAPSCLITPCPCPVCCS